MAMLWTATFSTTKGHLNAVIWETSVPLPSWKKSLLTGVNVATVLLGQVHVLDIKICENLTICKCLTKYFKIINFVEKYIEVYLSFEVKIIFSKINDAFLKLLSLL